MDWEPTKKTASRIFDPRVPKFQVYRSWTVVQHAFTVRSLQLQRRVAGCYELWVIATRAVALNGLGMSVSDTKLLREKCIQQFRILRDERGIFDFWFQIVSSNQVIGKSTHDARLVAAMVKHSIQNILTFNVQDFKHYLQIKAFDPADILAGQLPSSA